MQTFSETAPLYNKIALHNAWNLSQQLGLPNNQRDIELMFYYLCNMLSLRKQIIDTIGDLQFADLTAERIIIELGIAIRRLVVDQFGQINTSRMTSLVNGDLPFHRFHEIIADEQNRDLFHDFEVWITEQQTIRELEQNCRWYAQLIMYELNYVYIVWYGEPPDLLKLSPDLREHLETTHPTYFQRLRKIDSGSWL
jgi:hypothetical protein